MTSLCVTTVRLKRASPRDRASGLVGFVSCAVNGLRIDGLTVRRTRAGHHRVTFPRRRDRSGRQHAIVRPVTAAGAHALEKQVLAALGLEEVA